MFVVKARMLVKLQINCVLSISMVFKYVGKTMFCTTFFVEKIC